MAADKDTLDQLRIDRTAVPEGRSRGLWLGLLSGLLLFLLAAAALWWWQRPQALEVQTVVAQSVTGGAGGGGAVTLLNATGYVTARREATVSSKVTGLIVEVLVEEGMRVEEGQVLARVDASNVAASLRLAEARLAAARAALGEIKANLDLAERMFVRMASLVESRSVSVSQLDQADGDVKALRARLERQRAEIAVAESEVAAWEQQLDDTIIRAPFAGVVTSKNAQPGEMISPMSAGGGFTRTGVCTIVDMASLEVEVDVNESYINRVTEGQPVVVTLDAYPDWPVAASVLAIIPTADRQRATVRVRIAFDELDPRMLPEMGLRVAFRSVGGEERPTQRVVVPREAIHRVNGRDVVWIAREGRVERRAVSIGATQGSEVTLTSGLQGGERLVVNAPESISEGTRIMEQRS